jgi:hypothetical protein
MRAKSTVVAGAETTTIAEPVPSSFLGRHPTLMPWYIIKQKAAFAIRDLPGASPRPLHVCTKSETN